MKKTFTLLSLIGVMALAACGSSKQGGGKSIGRVGNVANQGAGSGAGLGVQNGVPPTSNSDTGYWVSLTNLSDSALQSFAGQSVTIGHVATAGCHTLNGLPCGIYIRVAQNSNGGVFTPPILSQNGSTDTAGQGDLTIQIFDDLTGNGTSQAWAEMNMDSGIITFQNQNLGQNNMIFDTGVTIQGNVQGTSFSAPVSVSGGQALGYVTNANICQFYSCY